MSGLIQSPEPTQVKIILPASCGYQLLLSIREGQLCGVDFLASVESDSPKKGLAPKNLNHSTEKYPLRKPNEIQNGVEIVTQFEAYFSNPNIDWDIPIIWPKVSEFQKRVCEALSTIPLAQTLSYGELAKKLNSSPRAVGGACRRNPFPIIFPCHRVVAKNGIGGYSGDTEAQQQGKINKLNIKQFLLAHEQQAILP